MRLSDRLDIYGPSTCPACGNRMETIFTRHGNLRELVCRNHPGHPLHAASGMERVTSLAANSKAESK